MQITLDKNDIDLAVKTYMKDKFGIEASSIEFSGTKDKMVAAISLAVDTTVKLGEAEITILGDKPVVKLSVTPKAITKVEPKTVEAKPIAQVAKEIIAEPIVEVVVEPVVEVIAEPVSLSVQAIAEPVKEEPVVAAPTSALFATPVSNEVAEPTDTLDDVLHLDGSATAATPTNALFAIPK